MACLVMRVYTKTVYRGTIESLSLSPSVLQVPGVQGQLPHDTTIQKFSARSKVLEITIAMIQSIGQGVGDQSFGQGAASMDATGLEMLAASALFQCHRGGGRRKWVKISIIVLCGGLLSIGLVMDWVRSTTSAWPRP